MDPYTEGYALGYADHESGCEYAPEEDGEEYEAGYADGWDAYEGDEP